MPPVGSAKIALEFLSQRSGSRCAQFLRKAARVFEPRLEIPRRGLDHQRRMKSLGFHALNRCGREVINQAQIVFASWPDVNVSPGGIPWLRLQNRHGRHIYLRPRCEHKLSLIDDLTAASIERMKAEGFHPALVVETSPGNFQAWLKHSRRLSKELGTAAARALAQEFEGDLGAADWRHFGRLAGFTNRKEKYKADGLFPFVMLRQANGLPYPEAGRFIAQIEKQVDRDRRESERRRAGIPRGSPSGVLRSIDSFRANSAYAGDGTRIDLAYAIYALAHGVPDAQIDDAIRSRDLTHKGNEKRQAEYVERTLRKAATIVDRGSRALGR